MELCPGAIKISKKKKKKEEAGVSYGVLDFISTCYSVVMEETI
jgi:hypothetical protein